jgi:nicotinate-nucleotide pyrophosphorylase (carboxylating)
MEDWREIKKIIVNALGEDVGYLGEDVTTNSTVAPDTISTARFLAKATGVLAGLKVADMVFYTVDPSITVKWSKKDGDAVTKGTYFGDVTGPARSLLVAERIALNLMQRMSGIATATNRMVQQCHGCPAKILDTRKTVPGLRVLDKMAHVLGGGTAHRSGLHDMVMIKDNHITASGGITKAVSQTVKYLKQQNKEHIKIEVETRTFDEVKEAVALAGQIDRIMLDNMVKGETGGRVDTSMLEQALKIIGGRVDTEASGNVTLDTVGAIAKTGVTYISTGAITHSVIALDISLKISMPAAKL